jgi:hypothetical protein
MFFNLHLLQDNIEKTAMTSHNNFIEYNKNAKEQFFWRKRAPTNKLTAARLKETFFKLVTRVTMETIVCPWLIC